MGEHYVEFGLFKDFESAPSTLPYCWGEVDSNEPVSMLDMTLNDPYQFQLYFI